MGSREESARLTEALETGLADLRVRLAGKLARALEPFLAEALRGEGLRRDGAHAGAPLRRR